MLRKLIPTILILCVVAGCSTCRRVFSGKPADAEVAQTDPAPRKTFTEKDFSSLEIRTPASPAKCLVANPGEDASTMMNISWSVDVNTRGSYVSWARSDRWNSKKRNITIPEQVEYCTVYDSVYSKTAEGVNFYEDQRFLKCGVELSGLDRDTRYDWVICDSKGVPISDVHHFKTAGASQWSACIISDFHSYTPLPKRLKAAMDMVRTVEAYDKSIDWILHLGDVTAWGGSRSFWERLYEEEPFKEWCWAGLNGNHDNMTRTNGQSSDFFKYANYVPQNGYGDQKGVCCHFRYGDVLFITLNNEAMHSTAGLSEAQAWVKDVVRKEKVSINPPRYIVVCEHYQWFYGDNGKSSHYARWNKLFDELGVDLALSGNNHIYLRSNCIYRGEPTDGSRGTVYIQTASSDNERGREMNEELQYNSELVAYRWTEGGKTVCALHLAVDRQEMTIKLLDRTGAIVDSVTIPARFK